MSSTRAPRPPAQGLSLAVPIVAALVLSAGCSKESPQPAAVQPIEVTVVVIAPRDVPVSSTHVAQTQSSQAVNIQARVSGFLDRRVYVEGSRVKAGQVLFEMDKKPFQADVDGAQAALLRSEAALEVARAKLARTKPLVKLKALSQKDLDDAVGDYEQAAANVEQQKAQLEVAKLNLSYTTITSPVDGVSSYAMVADGSYLDATNAHLTTVSVLSPMWINFSVSENEMQRVRTEVQQGLLRLPPDESFLVDIELVDGSLFARQGQITFADSSYQASTNTFLIRVSVDNPEGLLRPNQYVRLRLQGAVRPNAILVPQRAVQQGAKGHYVWVVTPDNQAQPRPVVVGDWQEDDWFINQGLRAGDQVVVGGALGLRPGTPVRTRPAEPPPVTAGGKGGGTPTPD